MLQKPRAIASELRTQLFHDGSLTSVRIQPKAASLSRSLLLAVLYFSPETKTPFAQQHQRRRKRRRSPQTLIAGHDAANFAPAKTFTADPSQAIIRVRK